MNRNDLNRFGTLALLAMAVSISACGGGDSEATGAPLLHRRPVRLLHLHPLLRRPPQHRLAIRRPAGMTRCRRQVLYGKLRIASAV